MRYFNYEREAAEAGLSAQELEMLCRLIREEFPTDEMMCELHVLRACMAIKDGYWTVGALRKAASALAPAAGGALR